MTAQESAATVLALNLSPLTVGGGRVEDGAMLDSVLSQSITFIDELRAIADRHGEAAPAKRQHVSALTAVLSRLILDWVEEWPA